MGLIVKSKFGSHLYGTSNENSDTDYKGIYLPSKEECYLNKISKSLSKSTGNNTSKNNSDDIDEEIYSLQYFMKLALGGEMIVIDMLHTPDEMVLESSSIWEKLREKRSMFYSKQLHGYLGYIKTQTAKYGVKGSRLAAMEQFRDFLKMDKWDEGMRLYELWGDLPFNEYSMVVPNPNDPDIDMYECCGRKFPDTIRVSYALGVITKLADNYGERARKARDNEGVDWKAVSHAFRAGFQLIEIYKTGDLIYPLASSEFLRDMKEGKFHYQNDDISGRLEKMLVEVNGLSGRSNLPNKVNKKLLDKFILECYT